MGFKGEGGRAKGTRRKGAPVRGPGAGSRNDDASFETNRNHGAASASVARWASAAISASTSATQTRGPA